MEWITDRPPKEEDNVLITHDIGAYSPIYRVDSAWVEQDENGRVYFTDTGYGDMYYGEWGGKVKAWMPLPEPFEE